MTTMTPSINKVFKLIFHDLTPRYPPCPLNNLKCKMYCSMYVRPRPKSSHTLRSEVLIVIISY